MNKGMIVLLLLFLGYVTRAHVKPSCKASPVTEGQTGVMTFFIRQDIDLLSDTFFAYLRRKDQPSSVLVQCQKEESLGNCKATHSSYQTAGIVNHSLTVLIPNITPDFNDTYVFQVHVDGKDEARDACFLSVKGAHAKPPCKAPPVTEGQTGVMTFFIRQDIDLSSDTFFAYLRREDQPLSVLVRCQKEESLVNCKATHPSYQTSGIVNHSLTVLIPNITPGFTDNYMFQVHVNDEDEAKDACFLSVKEPDDDNAKTASIAAPVAVVSIVIVIAGIAAAVCYLKSRRNTNTPSNSGSENDIELPNRTCRNSNAGSADHLYELIDQEELDNVPNNSTLEEHAAQTDMEGKPWYFKGISRKKAEQLLESDRNGHGTFLVRDFDLVLAGKTGATRILTLIANFNGEVLHFCIKQRKEGGVQLRGGNKPFRDVSDLVKHYTSHKIKCVGQNFDVLVKPAANIA